MWQDQSQPIRSYLDPNEKLLWSGQPNRGIIFRLNDLFLVPFSLAWSGFVFRSLISAADSAQPIESKLVLLPFSIVGLYVLFGRFLFDIWQRRKIHYAVTDKRVIIIWGIFDRRVTTANLKTMQNLTLTEKANGKGSIVFGGDPEQSTISKWVGGSNDSTKQSKKNAIAVFELIPDAKKVFDLVRQAQQQA